VLSIEEGATLQKQEANYISSICTSDASTGWWLALKTHLENTVLSCQPRVVSKLQRRFSNGGLDFYFDISFY